MPRRRSIDSRKQASRLPWPTPTCASSSARSRNTASSKRIPFEVDPVLEITEFADRSVKRGGPALLFEKPKGSNIPVLINAFAIDAADGDRARGRRRSKRWPARISEFLEMQKPEGLIGKLKMLPKLAEIGSFFPKTVSGGPVQGSDPARRLLAVRLPDPALLAAGRRAVHHAAAGVHEEPRHRQAQLRHVPHAGLSTSAPPACTGRPTSRAPSITAGWPARAARSAWTWRWRIGADPATMFSAVLPLPPDLDEMMFAGLPARQRRSRW